jgi:hypothetical protein
MNTLTPNINESKKTKEKKATHAHFYLFLIAVITDPYQAFFYFFFNAIIDDAYNALFFSLVYCSSHGCIIFFV